jgi:hypothetical protein
MNIQTIKSILPIELDSMNPNLGIVNWSQNSINKYERNAMNSARSANQLEKEVQKLNETFTSAKNNTNRYSSINGTRKVVNSRPFFQRMFTPRIKLYRNSASSRNAALAKKTRNNNYTRALKNRPLRNQKNTRKRANAAMANLSLKKFNAAMNIKEKLKKGNIVREQESNKRSKEVEEISKRSSAAIDQLNTAISNYAQRVKESKNKAGQVMSTSVPVASSSQSISYGPNYEPFTGLNFAPATAELEQREVAINNLDRKIIQLQQKMNQRLKLQEAKREQAAAALRASNAAEFATM